MEESVKELAECPICTDLFCDPRMLPCIHTFCLKCLNESSTKCNLKPEDSMSCPLCRTSFVIPTEGMVGLKKNFFMERLVEVTKISKPSKERVPSDYCTEEKEENIVEVPSAAHYCIHCQQHFCDRCCRDHKKFRLFKHHQLVAFGSPLKEELIRKFEIQYCDQHREEKAKLYCSECKQVICMMCFAEDHRSHNCSDIEKVTGRFRESIIDQLEQLRTNSDETLLRIQEIANAQTSLTSCVEEAEKAIIKQANELKEFVDKCAKSLLDELALIKQQTSKQLENEQADSERHHTIITSFEVYCKELTSKGSSAEICRFVEDFNSRIEGLQNTHLQHVLQQLPSVQFSFQASQSIVDFGVENIVGIITSQDKSVEALVDWVPELWDKRLFHSSAITDEESIEEGYYKSSPPPRHDRKLCAENDYRAMPAETIVNPRVVRLPEKYHVGVIASNPSTKDQYIPEKAMKIKNIEAAFNEPAAVSSHDKLIRSVDCEPDVSCQNFEVQKYKKTTSRRSKSSKVRNAWPNFAFMERRDD